MSNPNDNNPEVIKAAAEEKIILFTLPPHTTHLTAPLDKGPFSPLKTYMYWKRVCHDFHTRNPGRVVTQFDFSTLFSKAWKQAMNQTNILAGFRITGVQSNSKVQDVVALSEPDKFVPESLPKRIGLPLYSPSSGQNWVYLLIPPAVIHTNVLPQLVVFWTLHCLLAKSQRSVANLVARF